MRIPLSVDSDLRGTLQELWRAVDKLGQSPLNPDLRGRTLTNAGSAVDPFDLTTRDDVQALIEAAISTVPQTVAGALPTLLYGTHADRLVTAPGSATKGTLFWETDRAALYQRQEDTGTPAWKLLLCRPLMSTGAKPADLLTTDVGFTWFVSNEGVLYRWTGTAWIYAQGSKAGWLVNRPAAASVDTGFLYIATNKGNQVWRKDTSDWLLLEGLGGPESDVIANIPGTLTAIDAGYLFYATDYKRLYRWSGSAWADDESRTGPDPRKQVCWFMEDPGAGWALCNGSTVTISTSTGGTASYAAPDITTNYHYPRGNTTAGASGVLQGDTGATTLLYYYDLLPYVRL
jgi:hypothetical protein